MFRDSVVVPEEFFEHARALGAAIDGARIHQRREHSHCGVQGGKRSPARIIDCCRDCLVVVDSKQMQAAAQGRQEIFGAGILAPIVRYDVLLMKIKIGQKPGGAHPAPAHRRIHDFNPSPETAPHDDEVRDARRQHHDGDGGQRACFIYQHVIGGQHNLFGLEPELIGDFFDGVDGGAIHAGLAGLAQAAVVYRNTKAFQQRLERRRSAVHVGSLDHLRDDEAKALHRRVRSAMAAGERRETSTSAVAEVEVVTGVWWLVARTSSAWSAATVWTRAGKASLSNRTIAV